MPKAPPMEKRKSDPYLDRRSGEERREAYDTDYFSGGGLERRKGDDRRGAKERRKGCMKVSRWSSVCAENTVKESND